MQTQWAPGPLHPKGKVRVPLLQGVLFALDVHSVGVSIYGHYTVQGFWQSRIILKKTHNGA